jgi:hypothetical protein
VQHGDIGHFARSAVEPATKAGVERVGIGHA